MTSLGVKVVGGGHWVGRQGVVVRGVLRGENMPCRDRRQEFRNFIGHGWNQSVNEAR